MILKHIDIHLNDLNVAYTLLFGLHLLADVVVQFTNFHTDHAS